MSINRKRQPKYRKGRKYPTMRSIPLKNPRRVDAGSGLMTSKPVTGPTDECFDGDARWYAVKEGQLVRVTGEPENKPKYVVIEDDPEHVQLRLYHFGTEYFFVQLYWCIRKLFISVSYRGREKAMLDYNGGVIRWRASKPIDMEQIKGER